MTARIVSLGVIGLAEWSANRQKASLLATPFAIMEGAMIECDSMVAVEGSI